MTPKITDENAEFELTCTRGKFHLEQIGVEGYYDTGDLHMQIPSGIGLLRRVWNDIEINTAHNHIVFRYKRHTPFRNGDGNSSMTPWYQGLNGYPDASEPQ